MVWFAATELHAQTTVYVGKHFEVRDHDAPVKYVFNGETRIARVTGSLSANSRIQKLRLRAGWNLVSLAVTAPDFLDQLREFTSGPAPVIKALYRWQPDTRDYGAIAPGESVAAGAVLWVAAQTDAVVAVRGRYVEATEWRAPAGGTFVATPALEAQPLTVPAGVTLWRFDAKSDRWQIGLTGDLAGLSDLPPALAPGEAIFVHATEPMDFPSPAREERILYYHQDHLGSTAVLTDAAGGFVEETAFYPFGEVRNEHRLRKLEAHYKFTQKERDRESRLHYFEARYFNAVSGRFTSVDPRLSEHRFKDSQAAAEFFKHPQRLNHYAYALNNPLRFIDPQGEDVDQPNKLETGPAPKRNYTLELTDVETEATKPVKFSIESISLTSPSPGRMTRQERGDDPLPTELSITRLMDKSSSALMHMTTQGRHIKEATIIVTEPGERRGDKPTEVVRIKLTDVFLSSTRGGRSPGRPTTESFSLSAAKVEFKYPKTDEQTSEPKP